MKGSKATKRALFSSVISLILCFAMLIGTTFAWFTDSVTSGVNTITAGNLDIELYHSATGVPSKTDGDRVTTTTQLFQMDLWEPGAVVYENFLIANEGTLALKYALDFNNATVKKNYVVEKSGDTPTGTDRSLADVLYVKISDGTVSGARPSYTAADGVLLKDFLANNDIFVGALEAGGSKNLSVVVYWPQSENDNQYNLKNGWYSAEAENSTTTDTKNALYVELPIALNACQYTSESDSFDNQYDKFPGTQEPFVKPVSQTSAPVSSGSATELFTDKGSVVIPEGAGLSNDTVAHLEVYDVEEANGNLIVNDGQTVVSYQVELLDQNGNKIDLSAVAEKTLLARVEVGYGLDVNRIQIYRDGTTSLRIVKYEDGYVYFESDHFCDVDVVLPGVVAKVGNVFYYDFAALAEELVAGAVIEGVTASNYPSLVAAVDAKWNGKFGLAKSTVDGQTVYTAEAFCAVVVSGETLSNFNSFVDAYEAAKDGDTIRLVDTCTIPYIYIEKDLTIDLNGNVLQCSDTLNYNTFEIYSDVKIHNTASTEGKISMRSSYGIYVNGYDNGKTPSLIIENITIENAKSGYVFDCESYPYVGLASLEILSGNFKGGIYNYYSDVQVKGGRFSVDVSNCCVSGYLTAKDADGWYAVVSISEYLSSAVSDYSQRDDEAKTISIGSAGELIKLTSDVANGEKFAGYKVTLTADIDLNGKPWFAIGADETDMYFAGTFDGGNHTITMGEDQMLFGQLYKATVQNLNVVLNGKVLTMATSDTTFDTVTVKGNATLSNNCGAFVIYPSNSVTLRNCTNEAELVAGGAWGNYNAVFVGYGNLANGGTFTFENCVNKGSLVCGTASMFVGNISYGNPQLVINNCRNEGTIHAVYTGSSYIFNTISSVNNDGQETWSKATVDGVVYSGTSMRNVPFEYFGGTWLHGPSDENLALHLDENNKLVLTPSQNSDIAYYVVKVGVYGAIVRGGSCQYHVGQKVAAGDYGNITLKKLQFVDDTWVAEHPNAVMSKHDDGAGEYTMYSLEGTDYYLYYCGNNEYTLHGDPKMATEFSVSAYNAQNKLVASVGLS